MDIYILNELMQREFILDRYKSLIWTERFSSVGDFELIAFSTHSTRSLLTAGRRLSINASYRVMIIETVETSKDDEGRRLIKVTGRSLESILEHRMAIKPGVWTIAEPPKDLIETLYDEICIQGALSVYDIVPSVIGGSMYSESTIPYTNDTAYFAQDVENPETLYAAITRFSDAYDLGFRLVQTPNEYVLHFDVYSGSDRTSAQNVLPPVIFSTNLDNLRNTTEFYSTANHKNVAYVFSSAGIEVVYPPDVDPDVDGFERKVLIVKADGITEETSPEDASLIMTQKGREELAKHRIFSALDGEISKTSNYLYSRDYNLGDLVEMRNNDNLTNVMRVTEQIFVSDEQGLRSYPTLTVETLITPGSWLSWERNQVWEEVGAEEYWENQP